MIAPVPFVTVPSGLNIAGAYVWLRSLQAAAGDPVAIATFEAETGLRWPHRVMPAKLPAERIGAAELAWRNAFLTWFTARCPITDPELLLQSGTPC